MCGLATVRSSRYKVASTRKWDQLSVGQSHLSLKKVKSENIKTIWSMKTRNNNKKHDCVKQKYFYITQLCVGLTCGISRLKGAAGIKWLRPGYWDQLSVGLHHLWLEKVILKRSNIKTQKNQQRDGTPTFSLSSFHIEHSSTQSTPTY